MSIANSELEYAKALAKAHREYPLREKYEFSPDKCRHNFNFVVYCDGEWDIVRCSKCGAEQVQTCTFDDEYD
jgi:hypothetical protein